jgi:hypothetical protein
LDEQYADVIDKDFRVVNVELEAGHAQVVGKPGQPPFDLIAVLEENDVLSAQTYLSSSEVNSFFYQLYE